MMKSLLKSVAVITSLFSALSWSAPARPTLAVLYFDVHESMKAEQVFRKGLAQMLITDLAQSADLQVVERERLEEVLSELKLQGSAQVDPATAQRAGKLLGAKYLLMGAIVPLGKKLSFETRVLQVETGKVVTTTRALATMDDVYDAEQQLAGVLPGLIQGADRAAGPTPGAPRPPAHDAPTRPAKKKVALSFFTAARYAGALDALDAHDPKKAKELLTQVTTEAPAFELAQADLAKLTH